MKKTCPKSLQKSLASPIRRLANGHNTTPNTTETAAAAASPAVETSAGVGKLIVQHEAAKKKQENRGKEKYCSQSLRDFVVCVQQLLQVSWWR